MADPKDLQEAADAIHEVRGLAAVQRHKELDDPLRQAEEWPGKNTVKCANGTATRMQISLVTIRTLKAPCLDFFMKQGRSV